MEDQIRSNKRKTVLLILFLCLWGTIPAISLFLIYGFAGEVLLISGVLVALPIFVFIKVYISGTKFIAKIHKAVELDPGVHKQVYNLVSTQAITVGIPTPKIYVIDDPSINAFATGINPAKAAVGITTGALRELSSVELEAVLAHEISHIFNRDTRVMLLVAAIAYALLIMRQLTVFSPNSRSDSKNGSTALLGLLLILVFVVFTPLVIVLIKASVSRKREFLADHTGIQITRYPEGLIGALRKIQASPHQLNQAKRNPTTSHLFFDNPNKVSWWANLSNTHPPIEARIAALERLKTAGL